MDSGKVPTDVFPNDDPHHDRLYGGHTPGDEPHLGGGRILATLRRKPQGMTAATIAEDAGLAERTTLTHLKALHTLGDIERTGCGQRFAPYVWRLPDGAAPSQPSLQIVESVRTCQTCGGNLWHEVTRDTWRCATCDPPAP